jgi:glycerol-3-phosphate acyltransferase PlsX
LTTIIQIAVDAMGGDFGPSVVIPAALQAVNTHSVLKLILVGNEDIIAQHLKDHRAFPHPQLTIHHASQQVQMDDSPANALKNKKDSSMRLAIELVKEGKAQACVSAGNTGALMATARFVLKTIPGIDRPAIIASIPTTGKKSVRVLDLGANVDSKPEHLLQFAIMGTVLTRALEGNNRPRLGLLNIGHEDIKGNELVKQTAQLLQNNSGINYIGYIEADEVFKGEVDIVVCDGFVGNIALKASEGTTRLVAHFLKESFQQNGLTRLAGIFALPVLKILRKKIDPARYNGASFLGLQGCVIKSHGGTNVFGYSRAIEEAMLEIQQGVSLRIRDEVAKLLTLSEV